MLWANPAPLNTFPSQTISLNLSNYDAIIITAKGINTATNGTVRRSVHSKGITSIYEVYPSSDIADSPSQGWYSHVTVLDSGVTFKPSNDNGCIPLTIHGIKFDDFANANF